MPQQRSLTWLLILAAVGFALPSVLFLYWVVRDFTSVTAALHDRLALAFIADVFITLGVLAGYFAQFPPGRYKWPWLVGLSLLGTLAFGIAAYLWMNTRAERKADAA